MATGKLLSLAVVTLALIVAGCELAPAEGTVKGKVTLDGEPIDGGMIRFVPANGDSQPADSPIVKGEYAVTMPLGDKKVEVFWGKSTNGAVEVDTASQGTAQFYEAVPPQFNAQTTLTHTVERGEATKNFDLTSK